MSSGARVAAAAPRLSYARTGPPIDLERTPRVVASFGRRDEYEAPEPVGPAAEQVAVTPLIQAVVVPVLDAAALEGIGQQIRVVVAEAVRAGFADAAADAGAAEYDDEDAH